MFSLKNTIFEKYFGEIFHVNDPYKDNDGKGTLQRFTETLAEEWDEEVVNNLINMIDYTLVPQTVKDKFIPYLEKLVGLPVVSSDLAIRRRILERAMEIFRTKGTIRSYQLIFRALGFDDVELVLGNFDAGFDSAITFDHPVRRFDFGKCHKCQYYTLNLIGDVVIDDEMYQSIQAAILLVEPIYAQLLGIEDNGDLINALVVEINYNGDLVYTSSNPNQISLALQRNGDLYAVGASEDFYYIDTNGNLIYNGN